MKQGQYDLEEELKEVVTQREEFARQLNDNVEKQTNLLKVVEELTEKVSKLETQPFQTPGFMTSSGQNVSNPFGNLSTPFQVKADIDIGKFSETEPTPSDELNFNQWCIDVKSYQSSYPDNILLPAVRKSIVGRAKSIIQHLGPLYTVKEVILVLTQEFKGVASSDVIFKEFYQLRQERNEKVQVFSIWLRDALTRLSLRFPDRAPKEDQDKTLKDHFFYGICPDLHNSIRHLYDDKMVTFSQLLVKAHRNEEEEMLSKLVNKGSVMGNTLKERVDQLIAKSNQELPSNQRGNLSDCSTNRAAYVHGPQPERNGNSNFQKPWDDIHQNLWGPEPSAAGPFDGSDGSRPIQCFRCRGWGHPKRLCPSQLNYTRGGSDMEASLPGRGQATRESSSKKPISLVTDMHIS